ncbi:MAG: response regulator, partial [Dehalococcoidia bacterium]
MIYFRKGKQSGMLSQEQPSPATAKQGETGMEKPKMLIGDASTFMRIILKNALEMLGFEVVAVAKNAREVLDKCVETKPRMALIDLALEGMDSVALTRAITLVDPSVVVMLMVPQGL